MALARLLAEEGQREMARQELTAVYDRFAEGFETADLRSALRLIRDLADHPENTRGQVNGRSSQTLTIKRRTE
jgi:hypothetical protein